MIVVINHIYVTCRTCGVAFRVIRGSELVTPLQGGPVLAEDFGGACDCGRV